MLDGKKLAIVICAGGIGERMGAGKPKQFIEMAGGTSIIRRTVDAFRTGTVSGLADIIVVTAPAGFEEETDRLVNEKLPEREHARIVTGGAQRQDSVRSALAFLAGCRDKSYESSPDAGEALPDVKFMDDDIVLVHDGARPFVTPEIIISIAEAALEHGAAIAAVPVKDTIRDSENGTLDRSRLYSVQTPQGFRFGLIRDAVEQACDDGFYGTDDGSLAERAGVMPVIVPGSYSNIKITTPEDLIMDIQFRIGHGFDVHKLVPDRKLILGGSEIPYELGLLGHSDADVLTHALMDAMLGACALGDIGHLFPDNDDAFLGADSMKLLKEVIRVCKESGWEMVNCDVTVICQKPKLAPYISDMRQNLADVIGVSMGQVSVKATTTEKLGFTGRGEGIAAEAVCMMQAIQ